MTLLQHQRLTRVGLTVFALIELGLLINTGFEARNLYSVLQETDPKALFLGLMIFGFAFGLAAILTQLFGGLRLVLAARPVPAWGLAASIIAIMTLWGFRLESMGFGPR